MRPQYKTSTALVGDVVVGEDLTLVLFDRLKLSSLRTERIVATPATAVWTAMSSP